MTRKKIELDDVRQALGELDALDINASADAIRKHLGRGSKARILELRAIVEKELEKAKLADREEARDALLERFPLPAAAKALIDQLGDRLARLPLEIARAQEKQFSDDDRLRKNEMAVLTGQHGAEVSRLENRIAALEVQLGELQSLNTELQKELSASENARTLLTASAEALEFDLEALRKDNAGLQARLEEARSQAMPEALRVLLTQKLSDGSNDIPSDAQKNDR